MSRHRVGKKSLAYRLHKKKRICGLQGEFFLDHPLDLSSNRLFFYGWPYITTYRVYVAC